MCCVPQMENGRSAKVPFVEAVPDVKPPHQLFVYDILLCGQMFIQTKRQIGDLCVVCFPFASFVVVVVVVLVFI